MPRLRYIEESEKSPRTRELIESAKRTGAPDPRVVSLMTRSQLGIAWVEYWNKLLYQGMSTTMRITAMVVYILIGARTVSLVFQGVGGKVWIEDLLSLVPSIAFLTGAHFRSRSPDEEFPYGYRRAVLPIYSLIVLTEPLEPA